MSDKNSWRAADDRPWHNDLPQRSFTLKGIMTYGAAGIAGGLLLAIVMTRLETPAPPPQMATPVAPQLEKPAPAKPVRRSEAELLDAAQPSMAPMPATAPRPATAATTWSYRNCREARAAGATPLYRGQPGYGAHMDGDNDGIACEPYHGPR